MVDCAGLENRRAERLRGFESHPLRFSRSPLSYRENPPADREMLLQSGLAGSGAPEEFAYRKFCEITRNRPKTESVTHDCHTFPFFDP